MKALRKDTFKEIKNTSKRFISIVLIVLLGVGFFAGIKATSPDMQQTLTKYFEDSNMMDIQVISTLGLEEKDIEKVKNLPEIETVEGSYSKDVLLISEKEEYAVKVHSLLKQLNQLTLIEGRMPQNVNECVVESSLLNGTKNKVGDKITFSLEEENPFLKEKDMTIVGVVKSPLYISKERGSTKLATGKISYYLYVMPDAIESDYYTELYVKIKKENGISSFSTSYLDLVKEIKNKIEEVAKNREEERYDEIKNEAQKEIEKAEKELQQQKEDTLNQLEEAKREINQNKETVESGKVEIKKAKKALISTQNTTYYQFQQNEKKLVDAQKLLQEKEASLVLGKQELEKNRQDANQAIEGLALGITQIEQTISTLIIQKEQLQNAGKDTTIVEEAIKEANKQKGDLQQKLDEIKRQLAQAEETILNGQNELSVAKDTLAEQKLQLQNAKKQTQIQFAQATQKIEKTEQELVDAQKKIEEAESLLKEKEEEATIKLAEAEQKIVDAKQDIEEIPEPKWYVLGRTENAGFASYAQDTDRIANIGKVFPIVFFVVAALISLTSMTRMVEEQRTQIGTLKALGYGKIQIASKYIIYATLATVIGSVVGMAIGFEFLPRLIVRIYEMMYVLPPVIVTFNMKYATIGLGIALLCTVGATIYSCYQELKSTPSQLMRPKSPKAGKRVLLEHIPFIWKRLKFSQKVTIRNIFRYKKRFMMTIIGILGCTALMVAGFGLRDAVSRMIPSQYGEVFKYDISLNFNEELSGTQIENLSKTVQEIEEISKTIKVKIQNVDIMEKNNKQDIQLIVPESTDDFSSYIMLKNRKTKQEYDLSQGVVITEKLANLLKIKEGDYITIKNAQDDIAQVLVTGITTNYLMHYMYMSPQQYQECFKKSLRYDTTFAIMHSPITEEEEKTLTKELLLKEGISNVSFTSATKSIFDDVMDNMSFVVWILIISAGMLAFVVLYNLSNVNISERIRELATIKVLGFYDKEVYQYVSRETVILTFIGIALGLVGGYILNMFIIKTCELDMMMMDSRIYFATYLYATILTIIFTLCVNIITYFSLKKVDMIESLKSVE